MSDELIQRLVRMAAEAEGLARDTGGLDHRSADCLKMSRMQAMADAGATLSAVDDLHVRNCPICGPRWSAMLVTRPAAAVRTAPSRWYRLATGLTAAAACVAAALTILPRPPGPGVSGPIAVSVQPITLSDSQTGTRNGMYLCVPGDSNCDGVVDNADLTALGFAVHRPEEYADRFPNCDAVCSNDVNGDAVVDQCDLDELVQCVGG